MIDNDEHVPDTNSAETNLQQHPLFASKCRSFTLRNVETFVQNYDTTKNNQRSTAMVLLSLPGLMDE